MKVEILPPETEVPRSRRVYGRRRRRSRLRRFGRRAAAFLAVAALGVCLGMAVQAWREARDPVVLPAPARQTARPFLVPEARLRPVAVAARTVYRYSVVPGGVYGSDEVLEAVDTDPAVAAHYSDIAGHATFPVHVPRARAVHVSYRIGDRIYWTKRRVTLHAGETLLTDGTSQIRARCGNRVSEAAQEPTSPLEPAPEELDRPIPTTGAGPLEPLEAVPLLFGDPMAAPLSIEVPVPSVALDIPQFTPPAPPVPVSPTPRNLAPPSPPPPAPPPSIPEPAVLMLLGSGLMGLAWRLRRTAH